MKSIITVVGKDKVGIIANVCICLSNNGINILDISQTILSGYFSMMMIVEFLEDSKDSDTVADALEEVGREIGVEIKIQHEDIFNAMHRI